MSQMYYGVATISRLPTNIGLFCKRALSKRLHSAKETYILYEPVHEYTDENMSPMSQKVTLRYRVA